jgi:hypothetical protein
MPVSVNIASAREKRAVGERPKLRLIRGKGMGTVEARKRPALTLVPRQTPSVFLFWISGLAAYSVS